VTGVDEAGEAPWTVTALVDDETLVLELDGPVQPTEGVSGPRVRDETPLFVIEVPEASTRPQVVVRALEEGGPLRPTFAGARDRDTDAIRWPDGNAWTKLTSPP